MCILKIHLLYLLLASFFLVVQPSSLCLYHKLLQHCHGSIQSSSLSMLAPVSAELAVSLGILLILVYILSTLRA